MKHRARGSADLQVDTTQSGSLRASTISGARWTIAATVAGGLLQLGYSATISRVLPPSAFGISAGTALILRFIQYFAQLGASAAIVQAPELNRKEARDFDTFIIALGLAIFCILGPAAPLTATLLRAGSHVTLVLLLTATVPVTASTLVPIGLLRRQHRYRALAVVDVGSYILGYPVGGLLSAHYGLGATSLGVAALTQVVCQTVAVRGLVRNDYGSLFPVQRPSTRLMGFGAGVSIVSFIEFWSSNLDSLYVATFKGPYQLGQYSRGSYIAWLPPIQIGNVISRVFISTFARRTRQECGRDAELGHTYLALVLVPFALYLSTEADRVVRLMLGPQWSLAATVLPILAIAGAVNMQTQIFATAFEAQGILRTKFWLQLFQLTLFIMGLVSTTAFDLDLRAVAYSWLGSELLRYVAYLRVSHILLAVQPQRVVLNTARAVAPVCAVILAFSIVVRESNPDNLFFLLESLLTAAGCVVAGYAGSSVFRDMIRILRAKGGVR